MRYASVCSGIEAATAAWHALGWHPIFFSEIDGFPCRLLAQKYPSVSNLGDMTSFQEWPDHAIDLLVGGTPCQSFSVAGLRQGLADPRGNLMLTFGAVAERYRPRWIVWENVPGVLSSAGGRDFGTFLGMLAELGYGFAYRVLDAQHVRVDGFGWAVPQRRRRVFVVGHLGDWRRAAAVLFEPESLRGHTAPRREAGQSFTHATAPCLTSSGRAVERAGDTRGQDPVVAETVFHMREVRGGECGDVVADMRMVRPRASDGGLITSHPVACTLTAREYKGALPEADLSSVVAHALRGEGFDASEDGTGRGTPIVPVAYGLTTEQTPKWNEDCALTLTKQSPTGGGQPQAVAFAQNQRDEIRTMDVAGALAAEPGMKQQTYLAQPYTIMERGRDGGQSLEYRNDGTANAILTPNGGRAGMGVGAIAHEQWAVRRLTPTECERLQGFPDGYTDIGNGKGGPTPDGPRYKALGNSMAVNVMRWIGRRIEMVENISSNEEAA